METTIVIALVTVAVAFIGFVAAMVVFDLKGVR